LREGPAPRILPAARHEDIVEKTVEKERSFLGRHYGPRGIAVSYMTRVHLGRPIVDDIRKALLREGMDVFWLTDPARKDARTELSSVNAPVILSTVHSLKGLEFPAVVMSTLVFGTMSQLENRKLVYVGMTRACRELSVIAHPEHPFAESLMSALRTGNAEYGQCGIQEGKSGRRSDDQTEISPGWTTYHSPGRQPGEKCASARLKVGKGGIKMPGSLIGSASSRFQPA